MREILFRGKRTDGIWVCGYYFAKPILEKHFILEGENQWMIDPHTVSQFSGLYDNNGTKIFEGDILKFSYTGKNEGVEGAESVVFKNGKFGVEWGWHRELVALDGFANTMIEVIGNIHDNPELLGGVDNG